jgi:hypothetical protein
MSIVADNLEIATDEERIVTVPLWSIRPSPLNDQLYHPISTDDPSIIALAESIAQHGLKEAIVISADHYILSGHRRHVAAQLAGLDVVPVRIRDDITHEDPDRFLVELREYNRQRVKSFDEQLREAAVTVNPDEAYQELQIHRKQKSAKQDFSKIALTLGERRNRKRISKAKVPMIEAIQKVLDDLREFWPLTIRTIHYGLLNIRPLKHASKPKDIYGNTKLDYDSLVELTARARVAGIIPWDAIHDPERVVETWNTDPHVGQFLDRELSNFARGYWRNLQASQPNHIELFVEKLTLENFIRPVAARYCVPFTLGKGMCSLPPRDALAKRFEASGKEKMIVLLASDLDPDGVVIAENFARSMRDDFKIPEDKIIAIRIAMTGEQVKEYDLPAGLELKEGSTNYAKFLKLHGDRGYELEAISAIRPELFQKIISDAIESVMDIDAFNREVRAERDESHKLAAFRQTVMQYLQGVKL